MNWETVTMICIICLIGLYVFTLDALLVRQNDPLSKQAKSLVLGLWLVVLGALAFSATHI